MTLSSAFSVFHRLAACVAVSSVSMLAVPALAQSSNWPTKSVKILVGSPPGAPSDITARLVADALSKRNGHPAVVENRPGAGNNLAASVAANAEADGHTLVLIPDTVLTVNPLIYGTQRFDARKDLVSVSVVASFSQMLVCHPSVGVKTVSELVEKSKKERITYGSGGPGVPGHLAAEMFLQASGGTMDHVPYRGPAPATQAVLAGEVNCGFLATPTVLPHVTAGKLVALAVSSSTPSPLAPTVPTLATALNQPDLDVSFRLLLQAPQGTPAPVVAAIEQAVTESMKDEGLRSKLSTNDLLAQGSTSAEAQKIMQTEIAKWEPLVKRLELKAN